LISFSALLNFYYIVISGEAEDPALTPVTWISKWVDYSDKYGLGYNLSDGSVGVLFNDATRLIMNENEKYACYYRYMFL